MSSSPIHDVSAVGLRVNTPSGSGLLPAIAACCMSLNTSPVIWLGTTTVYVPLLVGDGERLAVLDRPW